MGNQGGARGPALCRRRASASHTARRRFAVLTFHTGPPIVIGDNGPAHGGEAWRDYLAISELGLWAVRLPAYSPDFNPAESI
ncbi:MAG: transposase [Thermomicrobiales bacterium]